MIQGEKIRHLFELTPIPSMQFIYKIVAKKIKIKVQFDF